ncbi:1-phosphofructokinase [Bacillus sp. FJAT-27225]|uniref:1-phosphofructokinase family hexose kinase n=1 Tax=Bacillus sp. FJAT-27225 TaxID=1743144 RepID=UPI00080C23E6|nr:PfkB family carbohydrate kinase [Bacillus sp. FJAT-27225]OCA86058.1 1-phosphofructokinase [Bacillus sp. FJAT-27225]
MIHLICPNPAIDRTLLMNDFNPSLPNRPYEVKEFPGGKSFNVAYAIKQENPNAEICIHTILGGHNGEYLKELTKARHINLIVTEVQHNTRLCNILVDTEKNSIYPVYEKGLELSEDILETFSKNIIENIDDHDILVFSGSLMKGMPDTYIADISNKINKKNVKILIDTSGKPLVEAYHSNPYLIKINDEEILDLFPEKQLKGIDDYLQVLRDIPTIPYFIVTLGSKGVIAKMKNEFYYVKAEKIQAKNPIASGDFFLGILTNALLQELKHEEALKLAISYSTANCLNWYPEVNKFDIENIYQTITVEKL